LLPSGFDKKTSRVNFLNSADSALFFYAGIHQNQRGNAADISPLPNENFKKYFCIFLPEIFGCRQKNQAKIYTENNYGF